MNDVQDWWLSRFDLPTSPGSPPGRGDAEDRFAQVDVWVEFDRPDTDRHLVTTFIPGHVGRWVLAFSSYERFVEAHRGEDAEYSVLRGDAVLTRLPSHAGLWLDRGHPGGCKILFPQTEQLLEDMRNEG